MAKLILSIIIGIFISCAGLRPEFVSSEAPTINSKNNIPANDSINNSATVDLYQLCIEGKEFKNKYLEVSYDKFEDRTNIIINFIIINSLPTFIGNYSIPGEKLEFQFLFSYIGARLSKTDKISNIRIGFHSVRNNLKYSKDSHLRIIADTNRIKFDEFQYQKLSENGYVIENIWKDIPFDQFSYLNKIAESQKVSMQLFPTEFDLNDKQLIISSVPTFVSATFVTC